MSGTACVHAMPLLIYVSLHSCGRQCTSSHPTHRPLSYCFLSPVGDMEGERKGGREGGREGGRGRE